MELLQIGFATHFQVAPLFSMRTESQVSAQRCRRVDADAWYKRSLTHSISVNAATMLTLDQFCVATHFGSDSLGIQRNL